MNLVEGLWEVETNGFGREAQGFRSAPRNPEQQKAPPFVRVKPFDWLLQDLRQCAHPRPRPRTSGQGQSLVGRSGAVTCVLKSMIPTLVLTTQQWSVHHDVYVPSLVRTNDVMVSTDQTYCNLNE